MKSTGRYCCHFDICVCHGHGHHTLKFYIKALYVMGKAMSGELPCKWKGLVFICWYFDWLAVIRRLGTPCFPPFLLWERTHMAFCLVLLDKEALIEITEVLLQILYIFT